jgi:site-specific DNA-methyltransferase (adenine-specific)
MNTGNYKFYTGDSAIILQKLLDEQIQVDLTVTSPPYDDLRNYGQEELGWNFEKFKTIANLLYDITKPGGIVVWVVGDSVEQRGKNKGGETLTSFKQALYFQEIGFKCHDTMIYEKNSSSFPARPTSKRYTQIFEYMFVFVKGKIREDISLIADKPNKWAGHTNWGQLTAYDKDNKVIPNKKKIKPVPDFSLRTNIWKYTTSCKKDKTSHPAIFPEDLAKDHILSWSKEGDIVLDPFMGSGTTGKMAILNNRNFIGIELNEDFAKEAIERIRKYSSE